MLAEDQAASEIQSLCIGKGVDPIIQFGWGGSPAAAKTLHQFSNRHAFAVEYMSLPPKRLGQSAGPACDTWLAYGVSAVLPVANQALIHAPQLPLARRT